MHLCCLNGFTLQSRHSKNENSPFSATSAAFAVLIAYFSAMLFLYAITVSFVTVFSLGTLAAMKKAKSNGADKPQAVILTGAQGDETHEARLRGYRSAVEQAGGTVLEVQYCDAQPDRAAAAMEAVMQKYPQGVDALLVTSDDMALAAIKCIWDNNSAAYQKTVICGFDGNQAAVEALDRGELTVDIAQQGYEMGYKAVEVALDALEGKSVESVIDSGSEVITADNIDAYIANCREKGLWS